MDCAPRFQIQRPKPLDHAAFFCYIFQCKIHLKKPLFTLGSAYNTSASGAKQTTETNTVQIEHNNNYY